MDKQRKSSIDALLKGTARSFYLTVKALPSSIRWPIALAYLLARATDTIADEYELDSPHRLRLLAEIKGSIHGDPLIGGSLLSTWLNTFRDDSMHYLLLNNLPQLIANLHALEQALQKEIIWVLDQIIAGQCFDVVTFDKAKGTTIALHSAEELDQYTYYVAGSVGEFWNRICLDQIKKYSNLPTQSSTELAISFGKGLQLLNIIRDFPADLRKGRCYLPLPPKELENTLNPLNTDLSSLDLQLDYWRQKTLAHLNDGWNYMMSINNRRIRYALSLTLLIGFSTLGKLKNVNHPQSSASVKISRGTIKWLALIATIGLFTKKGLNYFAFFWVMKKMDIVKPNDK